MDYHVSLKHLIELRTISPSARFRTHSWYTILMRILLSKLHQRRRVSQHSSLVLTLPPYTPDLYRFVHFAVGDNTTATNVLAEVLALSPQNIGEAIRLLMLRLPTGWLSWPGAPSPGQWLALGIRREQADSFLSVMGEWTPVDRLALALHLQWEVPREDLDKWLGTSGMAMRVARLIYHAATILKLIDTHADTQDDYSDCARLAEDLLSAFQQDTDPAVHHHLLSCAACHEHIQGLKQAAKILRQAITVFFPAAPPTDLMERVAQQPRLSRWQIQGFYSTALIVLALLGIASLIVLRPSSAPLSTTDLPSAGELLHRAIHRFDHGPRQGVLHEQVKFGQGDKAFEIERWYDYRSPHRIKMIVRRPKEATPILDLSTNGTSWVGYKFALNERQFDEALVRDPIIRQVAPLLRQLPFAGAFGRLPIDQDNLDLTLLTRALKGHVSLLGMVWWQKRPAYLLASQQLDDVQLLLTIDHETYSLLEARSISDADNVSTTPILWKSELTEVLSRAPAGTFQSPTGHTTQFRVDPRRLMQRLPTNMDLSTAVDASPLPMPKTLPDQPLIVQLRELDWPIQSILQLYESEWSTLAIVVPRGTGYPLRFDTLSTTFRHGRYALIPNDRPSVTIAELAFDSMPYRRVLIYYWNALASDAEREATVSELINDLELVDQHNLARYTERFEQPLSSQDDNAVHGQAAAQFPVSISSVQPKRRYFRWKTSQLDTTHTRDYAANLAK
jgi:hypothetical protein